MAPCIGAEQTALLPGRDIRDSLTEVFVVLAELVAQGGGGAAVLLDIAGRALQPVALLMRRAGGGASDGA
eukprot:25217-Chlamydomonas_euryale.AAC.1